MAGNGTLIAKSLIPATGFFINIKSRGIKMQNSKKSLNLLIEEDTDRRCRQFHEYSPSLEAGEINPITFQKMVPAIISFIVLTGLLIYGMVHVFPRY